MFIQMLMFRKHKTRFDLLTVVAVVIHIIEIAEGKVVFFFNFDGKFG